VAYPEDELASDEEILLHRHPHWRILLVPVLVLLVVVALGSFLSALIRNQGWAHLGWIALAVLGGCFIVKFTLLPVSRWATTHFVVTDRRVFIRQGIVRRAGLDIPTNRITRVRFRHGLLDRLLGAGTLIIESAWDEPLEFDNIPRVEQTHSLLYHQLDPVRDGADTDQSPAPTRFRR